jgi:hypothetical protein
MGIMIVEWLESIRIFFFGADLNLGSFGLKGGVLV